MSPDLYWVAVALTTIIASSRLIRLWTHDDFPPVAAVRNKFLDITEQHLPGWAPLGFCPWCAGFWITLAVIGLGIAADVYGYPPKESDLAFLAWWIIAAALAGSYLAAILMVHDGDNEDDDDETAEVA